MGIFESIFDISYLAIVIALGVRLLLESRKGAKLFGIMAILLGLGDAFHLLPRVISHLSPLGFEGHAFALSWGQFVTSITMTVFYVLYYYYYRNQSGDRDNKKLIAVFALAALRIILVLMPQNNWGLMPGDYMFGIYRNIPFAILGALLIYWSYKERTKDGLGHMWYLILLSFLFYIPVVLWSQQVPIIGALMMPKTAAYLMIVVLGYRYFVDTFKNSNILGISFTFLIMGLVGGVFYREFTKFYNYTQTNHLGKIHVHTLVLGFIGLLLIYLLTKRYDSQMLANLKKPIVTFASGLTFTLVNLTLIGIYEVVGLGQETISRPAIDGISGLGHIVLGVGLVWTIIRIYRMEQVRLVPESQ